MELLLVSATKQSTKHVGEIASRHYLRRRIAPTSSAAKQSSVSWVRGLNGAIAWELCASYPAFKQVLVTRQSRKNVKEHANMRFTKQNCALSRSFHVSMEESISQTSQDVPVCKVTLASSANKILKAVMVCTSNFLQIFFTFSYNEIGF